MNFRKAAFLAFAINAFSGYTAEAGSVPATFNLDQSNGTICLVRGLLCGVPIGQVVGNTFTPAGLAAEINRAQTAEKTNAATISNEAARAAAAEAKLAGSSISNVSPAFTGVPTAPTALPLTANSQIATTSYADGATSAEAAIARQAEQAAQATANAALPHVATSAALRSYSGAFSTVHRDGFYAPGDGGNVDVVLSSSACATPDNGYQTPATSGGCWFSSFSGSIDARSFGVRCDATTDDSPALQAAINAAATLHAREVTLPATGHSCRLAEGVIVSDATRSGVTLKGTGGLYWPGYYNNFEANWTAFGTWIRCEDITNTCLTLNGNGSAIDSLNFWYNQPTPAKGGDCGTPCTMTHNWTPTAYPYTITVAAPQNFNHISNVHIINATNCIDIEGPPTGVGTFNTYIEHSFLGCFNIGTKMVRIDNAFTMHDVDYEMLWYQADPDVVGYEEGDSTSTGHKIDWDMYYSSNFRADDIQFFQSWAAIRSTESSVSSGLGTVTFGTQAAQLSNILFNQVCRAIVLGTNTTHFNARMTNVALAIDTQTSSPTQCGGYWPNAFDLPSDNVDLAITNLDAYFVSTIANIGGGTGGVLHLVNPRSQNYSAFVSGSSALNINKGAVLDMPTTSLSAFLTLGTTAGPRLSGLGGFASPPTPGFRNKLINGSFGINQRNFTSGATLAAGAYGHDRWKAGANGVTYTFSTTGLDSLTSISAGSLIQTVEPGNVGAGVYTLSWTGSATCRVYQGSATGSYVTGPITIASVTAATAVSVECQGGTLTDVQLEAAALASPFERRPVAVEMTLAQRYFVQLSGLILQSPATGTMSQTIVLPVYMRAQPTAATVSGPSYNNASGGSVYALSPQIVQIQATASATNGYANAWTVSFSAEL